MADSPLFDDTDLEDDPELLSALTAAFGDEGVESFSELQSEATDGTDQGVQETLESLVSRLDQAIDELGPAHENGPTETEPRHRRGDEIRHVVFEIAGQLVAFPLTEITEIERLPQITALPRTPSWCLGIANIRGQIVSVTDLALLAGMARTSQASQQKVIITQSRQHNATTAIVVDRVIGIRVVQDTATKKPDDLKSPLASFVTHIARTSYGHTLLVDPGRVFAHPDMEPFMNG